MTKEFNNAPFKLNKALYEAYEQSLSFNESLGNKYLNGIIARVMDLADVVGDIENEKVSEEAGEVYFIEAVQALKDSLTDMGD